MRKLKFLSVLLALLLLSVTLLTACNEDSAVSSSSSGDDSSAPQMADLDFSSVSLGELEDTTEKTEYVKLVIEDYGTVVIRLFANVAPITVANFQKLVSEGFYDGLTFHRVIPGFMIQGGDPRGDGTGDAGADIKGEFKLNRVTNNLQHVRGVVSMARSGHPYEAYLSYGYTYADLGLTYEHFEPYYNSASCQFFIVHQTSAHLNGSYASFGFVVYGMDVVDDIAAVATNASDKPLEAVTITSAGFMKKK